MIGLVSACASCNKASTSGRYVLCSVYIMHTKYGITRKYKMEDIVLFYDVHITWLDSYVHGTQGRPLLLLVVEVGQEIIHCSTHRLVDYSTS